MLSAIFQMATWTATTEKTKTNTYFLKFSALDVHITICNDVSVGEQPRDETSGNLLEVAPAYCHGKEWSFPP